MRMPGAMDTLVPMLEAAHSDLTASTCRRRSMRHEEAGLLEIKSNSTSSKNPGCMRPEAHMTGSVACAWPWAGTVTGTEDEENGVRESGKHEKVPVASTAMVDLKRKTVSMVLPGRKPP